MTGKEFTTVLKNPYLLEEVSIKELRELIEEYPYSQVLHNLLARKLSESKGDEFKQALNKAATYSGDRVFLYHYINDEVNQSIEPNYPNEVLPDATLQDFPMNLEMLKEKKEPEIEQETAKIIDINRPKVELPTVPEEGLKEELDMSTLEASLEKIAEKKESTVINNLETTTHEEKEALIEEIKDDFEELLEKVLPKETEGEEKEEEKIDEDLALEVQRDLELLKQQREVEEVQEPVFKKATQDLFSEEELEEELEEEETIIIEKVTEKKSELTEAEITLLSSLEEFDKIKAEDNEEDETEVEEKRNEDLFEGGAYDNWLRSFQPQQVKEIIKNGNKGEKGAEVAEKSISDNEEIVSEPLAQLLAIQGEKDKAIWMYKQLILKDPEKSEYFIQKIDYLKKN